MYNEKYFINIRSASVNSIHFIRAQCCAEMKKAVVYQCNISFDCNSVLECECECGAGMGPGAHCKHICALLYGLVQYGEKKEVNVQQTCTEKLQSFHKTKKFKGSPFIVSFLKLRNKNTPKSISNMTDFDPRPHQLRNHSSYPTFFRNICINFMQFITHHAYPANYSTGKPLRSR